MVARKKSKLEKLLSFNQHKKRFGAKELSKNLAQVDYNRLKATTINDRDIAYTHGSEKSLHQHIENLRSEFAGQSELLHYHAKLIVLIRREFDTSENVQLLNHLWLAETEFLLKSLNTRWLVAAADTFAEHSQDRAEKTLALSISMLVNTLKLVETERFLQCAEHLSDNKERLEQLSTSRVSLFDGTSAFAVGTDDTLRNMRWRLDDLCQEQTLCSRILTEIFTRIQSTETIYQRFRQRHTRKKTNWW